MRSGILVYQGFAKRPGLPFPHQPEFTDVMANATIRIFEIASPGYAAVRRDAVNFFVQRMLAAFGDIEEWLSDEFTSSLPTYWKDGSNNFNTILSIG